MKEWFIDFYQKIFLMITKPESFFESFQQEEMVNKDHILRRYFYPLLGGAGLVAFVMSTIRSYSGVAGGVKGMLVVVLSFFAALFLCNYLFLFLGKKMLGKELDKSRVFALISYSLLIILLVKIVTTILPFLFFLNILNLYVFYLLYISFKNVFGIDIEKQELFLFSTGLLVVVSPYFIEVLLKFVIR